MDRTEATFRRLRALIPPPAPTDGWGLVRLRAEAAQLAGPVAEQVQAALAQLRLGATLVRTDAAPGSWDMAQAVTWAFRPVLEADGASEHHLDAWGRALAVARVPKEPDPAYARRILAELVRPSTTNLGLARILDDTLGVRGTQVLDSLDALRTASFNAGARFNQPMAHPVRAWGFDHPFATLPATFVVVLPAALDGAYTKADIEALLDRRKAAGTRLLRLAVPGLAPAPGPDPVPTPLPRPSRFGAPLTRFQQPRAFEATATGDAAGRFNGPSHLDQARRFLRGPKELP